MIVINRTLEDEVNYARGVYDLCKKHGILFIADEVRMGAGKTGKFFCHEHLGSDCKPDIICMAKSMTGGFYPASYVLGTEAVMSLVGTAEMAATFAFTPLGVAATNAALDVIYEEGLIERAAVLGKWFDATVASWQHELVLYSTSRGADFGLFIDEHHPSGRVTGRKVCALCVQKGLLVSIKDNKVRMSVPMVIKDEEMNRALEILKEALDEVVDYDEVPGEVWEGKD